MNKQSDKRYFRHFYFVLL